MEMLFECQYKRCMNKLRFSVPRVSSTAVFEISLVRYIEVNAEIQIYMSTVKLLMRLKILCINSRYSGNSKEKCETFLPKTNSSSLT